MISYDDNKNVALRDLFQACIDWPIRAGAKEFHGIVKQLELADCLKNGATFGAKICVGATYKDGDRPVHAYTTKVTLHSDILGLHANIAPNQVHCEHCKKQHSENRLDCSQEAGAAR